MATLTSVQIASNDWDIVSGRSVILTDKNALSQRIKNRITLWYGEWYQDKTLGTDWLALFNLRLYQERRLSVAIKKVILSDPLVVSVNFLTSSLDALGNVTVSYDITSTFGQIGNTVTI